MRAVTAYQLKQGSALRKQGFLPKQTTFANRCENKQNSKKSVTLLGKASGDIRVSHSKKDGYLNHR